MNWRKLKNAAPRWSALHALARHPALKYAPLWLLAIPLSVKLLNYLQQQGLVSDVFALPFSFSMLYFAALLSLLGALLLALRCPSLVASYATLDDFQKTGKGSQQLLEDFATTVTAANPRPRELALNVAELASIHASNPIPDERISQMLTDTIESVAVIRELKVPASSTGDAFWHMRNFTDDLRPVSRYSVAVVYVTAFMLLGAVVVRNAVVVIDHLWRNSGGQMSTAQVATSPKFRWINFTGTAISHKNTVVLHPVDDPNIEIVFNAADVTVNGSEISVREGAIPVRFELPSKLAIPQSSMTAGHPNCDGGPTMCIGRVEFCCISKKAIDSCAGSWRCP